MRAVIQRVSQASVSIEHQIVGAINTGFVVLLGIEANDNEEDVKWLSAKIVSMRIFNDSQSLMNLALKEVQGDLLLISQFTLFASTKKGNRPSYIKAARPEIAIPIYQQFVQQLEKELGKTVPTGEFGADMQIELLNDGPVTICIDTKNKE